MLQIRLFGGFDVTLTPDGAVRRLGPKPQALLAVLAMARGQPVPRSRLAGLLWGERDETLARHSLCQALTTVRAALGPTASEILVASPEGLRLLRERFELDVEDFEKSVRAGGRDRLEDAFRLYRGDFLEGLEIREPGFEDWMLSERYRLGELAAQAFARLLDRQAAAGNTSDALETARRLVALTPLDELAHARLIGLYAELGRRGLAEAHYARCSELLRRELAQLPGAELRAAIATARRRSPGSAESVTAAPTRPDADARQDRPPLATGRTKANWARSAAAAAVVLLIGTAGWTFLGQSIGEVASDASYLAASWELPSEPSIAVLPFEDLSGGADHARFAEGITNDIVTDLSKFSTLFVTTANTSSSYENGTVKIHDVARDLGVRYLLEGSARRAGDTLRVNAHLIDATTGQHVWAERYERPAENLPLAQKEITQTIVGMIASGWGELERAELERVRRTPQQDLQAYDLYLLGVAHKNRKTREDNSLARQMFEEAIRADPKHARAMAECSLTYLTDVYNQWTHEREEWLQKAEEWARRAIEVDPSEPWGFVALGLIYQLSARNDEALPLLERAHALNPNDYYVKEALGYALTYAGEAERGVELLEQAQRLNPYQTEDHPRTLAGAYFFAHRYRDALAAINQVIIRQEAPAFWLYKAAIHAQLGQMDEARAALAEARELDPGLTVQGEHERRLALGMAPANAELLSAALRKAGLPEQAMP